MGCGNMKGDLVKKMTSKQIERISIIEERHNLCRELSSITGEQVRRKAVPDWRWTKDMLPKTEKENNFTSKANTLDKSKSIHDDVEENKLAKESSNKKAKVKGRTQRSSTNQAKSIKAIRVFSPPSNYQSNNHLHLKENDPDTTNHKHERLKSFTKKDCMTEVKTLRVSHNSNKEIILNKTPEKSQKLHKNQTTRNTTTKQQTTRKETNESNPKLISNEVYKALLAKIRKGIQEGKPMGIDHRLNGSEANPIKRKIRRLSIGQPSDSDYEYEY